MFKGIYTPIITIFDQNNNPDKPSNEKLINKLISDGVDGIVFLGSIGEFYSMTHQEKKDYIKFALGIVDKRVKTMVGTASNNINEVIELNNLAHELGADCAMVLCPYFFALGDDSVYEYYQKISKKSPLPIMLYNFPERTSINMTPSLVGRLAADFENIIGVKDSHSSFGNTRSYIVETSKNQKDFCVFSGFDECLIPNLLAGGSGIIGGLSNFASKLFVDCYNAFKENDIEKIKIYQKQINKLMGLYTISNPFITAMKEAVKRSISHDFEITLKNSDIKLTPAQTNALDELLKV